jgi:hypothetical protein
MDKKKKKKKKKRKKTIQMKKIRLTHILNIESSHLHLYQDLRDNRHHRLFNKPDHRRSLLGLNSSSLLIFQTDLDSELPGIMAHPISQMSKTHALDLLILILCLPKITINSSDN